MINFLNKKLIILIILCVIFPNFNVFSANISETKESLNSKISDITKQIEALDREISQYQNQITQTSEEAKTLSNLIKELSLTRSKLLKEEQQTEKKIRI